MTAPHRRIARHGGRGIAAAVFLVAVAGCVPVGDGGAPSPGSPSPTTAPTVTPTPSASGAGDVLVVAVKGDWGAGSAGQRLVTRAMCRERDRTPFAIVVTTGDNFYNPDGRATRSNYYDPEACLIEDPDHRWRAAWGNHDRGGTSTRDVLGAARYYAWSEAGVDFFALDSNQANSAEQAAWLERALRASDARVKVVHFHHPPFTVGAHRPSETLQRRWVPLFERYGVTLVLQGHNHLYEHLYVRGIHYVTTGGGGASLTPCLRRAPTLRRCASVNHFLLVRFGEDRVAVRAIRTSGETLDAFEIPV